MPNLTLEEKRLQTLRRQLTGHSQNYSSISQPETAVNEVRPRGESSSDTTYLRSDLFKIGYLSMGALALELILFFASRSHLLKLSL